MLSSIGAGAGVLAKRWMAAEAQVNGDPSRPVPTWRDSLYQLSLLAFLMALLLVNYAFIHVFPTLAMVEDREPNQAHAALSSLNHEEAATRVPVRAASNKPDDDDDDDASANAAITRSIRATCRHLYVIGGLRTFFRGYLCHLSITLLTVVGGAVFLTVPYMPFAVGTLLATLCLVQLNAAWVHIVISARPDAPAFWNRLPPFAKTFAATRNAVLLLWAAESVTQYIPYGIYRLTHSSRQPAPHHGASSGTADFVWTAVSAVAFVACYVLVRMPAFVALVRVQASLLPPDEDTVVSFDRSFGGRVGPSVVDGRGYATIADALETFPRASWVRLYKMYAKVTCINFAAVIVVLSVYFAS